MDALKILQNWTQQQSILPNELDFLLQKELSNDHQCQAFGITPENGLSRLSDRAQLFQEIYPQVYQISQTFGLKETDILSLLWRLWLPLAIQLSQEKKQLNRPLIQGILGGQGTGKTTLSTILRLILKHLNYQTIDISLDDLYKTYAERQQLKKSDRRLIWRGPPGTHDVELGIQLLDQLRDPHYSQPIAIPRFDKSLWNGEGDRIEAEIIEKADIVLFEGWFVGVRPINNTQNIVWPDPINTPEDQQFAQDINQTLTAYLPLWERLDRLIVLFPIDYHLSKQWRKEAEQKMMAAGKTGMSEQQIDEFVNYFWKSLHPEFFILPLIKNPNLVDLVIEIDADHSPINICRIKS